MRAMRESGMQAFTSNGRGQYIVVAVVVSTLNRPFYPASSVPSVSVFIPYPREIPILWSHTVRQRRTKNWNIIAFSSVSKWNASVPGTRTQQHNQYQRDKNKKIIKPITKSEMKHNTNDARTSPSKKKCPVQNPNSISQKECLQCQGVR